MPLPQGWWVSQPTVIMAAQTFADAVAAAATDPCPVCFGDMKTSVKNQCGHSVCFTCQIELHRRGQSLCPQCRAPCEVPDNFGPPAPAPAPAPATRAAEPTTVRHCSVCNSTAHNKSYHKQFRYESRLLWHQRLFANARSPVLFDGNRPCARAINADGSFTLLVPIN